jgi:hypothetical protein
MNYLAVSTDRYGNLVTLKTEALESEDIERFTERVAIEMRNKLGLFFLDRDLLIVPVRSRVAIIHKKVGAS